MIFSSKTRAPMMAMSLARPTVMQPFHQQVPMFGFTRTVRKIVLTRDVENLGFAGEVCFVKPGYALNNLVPRRMALFYSDPKTTTFLGQVNVSSNL